MKSKNLGSAFTPANNGQFLRSFCVISSFLKTVGSNSKASSIRSRRANLANLYLWARAEVSQLSTSLNGFDSFNSLDREIFVEFED